MGGFLFATGGALRAAPVAAFQPPSASPLATRAPSADWIGRTSWSSRLVPPRRWPRRQSRRVPWVAFTAFTSASSLRDIGLGAVGVGGRSAAQRSGAEWSGGLLGMTHAPEVRWHGGSVGVCGGRSHFRVVGGQSAASAAGCCQSGAREKCQRTWTRDAQVQIVHGDIGATKRRSSCTEGQTGDSGSV